MKLKNTLILLIALLLIIPNAFCQEDIDNALTVEEVTAWMQNIVSTQTNMQGEVKEINDGPYTMVEDFGAVSIYYNSEAEGSRRVVGVKVNDSSYMGPRGEMKYDALSSITALYPNDNESMFGDRDFACLYIQDELPETASYGIVMRDGQRVKSVEYSVYQLLENDQYEEAKLVFNIDNNSVSSIAAFDTGNTVYLEDVKAGIEYANQISQENDYKAHKSSTDGSQLSVFGREDLIFSGMDFLSIKPDDIIAKLDKPDIDEVKEFEGSYLRNMSWDALDASFKSDKYGNALSLSRLTVKDDIFEGPRGLRIGDKFSSIYSRFRSSGNELDDNHSEVLYGTKDADEYGEVNYFPNGIEMEMFTTVSDVKGDKTRYVINLQFEVDELRSFDIYVE